MPELVLQVINSGWKHLHHVADLGQLFQYRRLRIL